MQSIKQDWYKVYSLKIYITTEGRKQTITKPRVFTLASFCSNFQFISVYFMSRYGVNSLLSCASNNYYYKIVSYVIHMIIFFFLLLFKDGPSVKQSKDGPYTMEYTGKLGDCPQVETTTKLWLITRQPISTRSQQASKCHICLFHGSFHQISYCPSPQE